MNLKSLALIALLTASLLISGCISQWSKPATNEAVTVTAKELVTVNFSVKGASSMVGKTVEVEKGANAFEEMKKLFDVNATMYSFGPMVNAINGENSPANSYWALYVDGNYSQLGINAITLDKNMQIEWRLEKIQMS